MTSGIGTYIKNFSLILTMSCFCYVLNAQSIYQSPHHCIPDITQVPSGGGGMGGGGAMGGGAPTTEGCPRPSFFFDTDTSATSWLWEMGDLNGSQYDTRSVNFFYPNEGVFTVRLTKSTLVGGLPTALTEEIQVSVGSYPQAPKFNDLSKADTTVCGGNTLRLNPYKGTLPIGDYSYLWYPSGDTTKTIDVDSSGCYSVEVTNNKSGCSRTASITVNFCLRPSGAGGGPEKWYFGNGATIEFERDGGEVIERDSLATEGDLFGTPEEDTDDISVTPVNNPGSNPLTANNATAMVYGPSGGLAYYTDGLNIYDGNDEIVTDAAGNSVINADPDASQGIVIVPKSNCNECPHHEYHVVYIDKDTKILTRATIDLRYNEGRGLITETNVPVAYPVTEKVTAVKNSDETGFVLITQETAGSIFTFVSVDSSGTQSSTQNIGNPKVNDASYSGYISTNTEGNKVAVGVVIGGQNFVEVYDFNKDSLRLENPILINLGYASPPNVYGIAFSENGDFLYVTIRGNPANGESSHLLQLPLILGLADDIAANITVIDSSPTEAFGAIQLGPINGPGSKFIYMAIDGKTEVPFIQQPDIRGEARDVGYSRVTGAGVREGVDVSGTSQAGLPNVVFANQQQSGDGLSATYRGNCFMAPTELETQDACSPLRNEVEWEFEDGTKIKGSPAIHTFTKLGWNKIFLRINIYNTSPLKGVVNNQVINKLLDLTESICSDTVIVDSIYIKPSPVSRLADSTYLCFKDLNAGLIPQDSIFLDPKASGGDSLVYEWFTAIGTSIGRDSILKVAAPSTYKLELSNEFDCLAKDETVALDGCEPRLFLPEAITPNGDSINDKLELIYAHISDFNIVIYNRWGELVFESQTPEEQWNGTVKGRIQSPTVYPYVITYRSKDFPDRGILKQKGTIWVLK